MQINLSLNDFVTVKLTHVGAELFNKLDNFEHEKYVEGEEVKVQLADLINPLFIPKSLRLPFEIYLDTKNYSYQSIFWDRRLIKQTIFQRIVQIFKRSK